MQHASSPAPDGAPHFEIAPLGPYALAASLMFLEGFAPAAYDAAATDHLHLAFVVDGTKDVAGVCVRSRADTVVGEVFGDADPGAVRAQVARILSLDVDGLGFAAVGERDPVIAGLQARYPGLRPVCFYSPYEAAAWALISHRIRIPQAAAIKARMAAQLGPSVAIHGETQHAFPSPTRLMQLEAFPGLFGRKVEYLRRLGEETAAGKLDAASLRALPVEQALDQLKTLPGVGDFSAQLILLRGAGEPDYLPTHEPRLARAVALAYGLDAPPPAEDLARIADQWRPYRTWTSFLLRVFLEQETHEIAGGSARRQPAT
jgi:DNA-3-methyladenine glycosylase II